MGAVSDTFEGKNRRKRDIGPAGRRALGVVLAVLFVLAALYCLTARFRFDRSVKATLLEDYLRISNSWKEIYVSEEAAISYMEECAAKRAETPYVPLKTTLRDKHCTFDVSGDMPVLKYESGTSSQAVVLFVHGGAFVKEMSSYHERFIRRLGRKMKGDIYAPVYPLAPEHTFSDVMEPLVTLYKELREEASAKGVPLMLIGDSAGGTIAAGLCVTLTDEGEALPDELVLISPAVDMTLSNPELKTYEAVDPMLALKGLRVMGEAWIGEADPRSPAISPIHADPSCFAGSDVTIYAGTRELFYPDIKLFAETLDAAGVSVTFRVGEDLNHDFPLFPIREGKHAIDEIAALRTKKRDC